MRGWMLGSVLFVASCASFGTQPTASGDGGTTPPAITAGDGGDGASSADGGSALVGKMKTECAGAFWTFGGDDPAWQLSQSPANATSISYGTDDTQGLAYVEARATGDAAGVYLSHDVTAPKRVAALVQIAAPTTSLGEQDYSTVVDVDCSAGQLLLLVDNTGIAVDVHPDVGTSSSYKSLGVGDFGKWKVVSFVLSESGAAISVDGAPRGTVTTAAASAWSGSCSIEVGVQNSGTSVGQQQARIAAACIE